MKRIYAAVLILALLLALTLCQVLVVGQVCNALELSLRQAQGLAVRGQEAEAALWAFQAARIYEQQKDALGLFYPQQPLEELSAALAGLQPWARAGRLPELLSATEKARTQVRALKGSLFGTFAAGIQQILQLIHKGVDVAELAIH